MEQISEVFTSFNDDGTVLFRITRHWYPNHADSDGYIVTFNTGNPIPITETIYESFEHIVEEPHGGFFPDLLSAWLLANAPEGATSYRITRCSDGALMYDAGMVGE